MGPMEDREHRGSAASSKPPVDTPALLSPSPGDKLSRLQAAKFLFSSVSIIPQSYSEIVRFPQLSAVFHSEVPAHFCRPPAVIS